jgi:hypothetical protein
MDLRPLTDDEISRLTDEEAAEYLEHLEAIYRDRQAKDIIEFARAVEVPGAPTPAEESDAKRRAANPKWQPGEVIEEAEEFYPSKLNPAEHHLLILSVVQDLMEDRLVTPEGEPVDGLIITAPPGSAKSSYASMVVPAFVMGWRPKTNVIAASYSQELSDKFSRRVRSIIASPEYQAVFPHVKLAEGNTAVRGWSLSNGSEYRSTGVGAGIAGFRCNLLIGDDLVANREDAESPVIREKTWNAVNDDLLPRRKGDLFKMLFINTRFHEDDHIGRFLGPNYKGQSGHWKGMGYNWYILNLPLVAEHPDDPLGRKKGQILWPENYKVRDVIRLRDDQTIQGIRRYSSLYQQRPAPHEGAIIKRAYWKKWPEGKKLPECKFIALFYDTSFEEEEMNDPSAMTAWGVFGSTSRKDTGEEYDHDHLILLGSWEAQVESVALPDIISDHAKHFRPDAIVVEKRASGHYVIQELRRRRLPVKAWLPKGKVGKLGKVPRAWAAALLLEPGSVWYVDGEKTRAVIDQCAAFPNATHDDLVDTVTMAVQWTRDRFLYQMADEEMNAEEHVEWRKAKIDAARPRRIYGSEAKKPKIDDEDHTWQTFTEETRGKIRRRLYNG